MTEEEALAAARTFLGRTYGDGPPTIVIGPGAATEYRLAWTVVFDTQEHIDTGDVMRAPLTRLLVVFKDGSLVGFSPTFLSVPAARAWYDEGVWPETGNRMPDPRGSGAAEKKGKEGRTAPTSSPPTGGPGARRSLWSRVTGR